MSIFNSTAKATVFVSVVMVTIILVDIYYYDAASMKTMAPLFFFKQTLDRDADVDYVSRWKGTNRSLTVVTAFFDLGKFPKGSFSNMRTPDTYRSWMKVYKFLKNPLVVYTDSQGFADFFTDLRKNNSLITKVVVIKRETLWSFKIKPKIAKLYAQPGYPKHYPNTYIPEYTSMTHSKLSVVASAITSKLFPSDFYCWLDLGYFRDLAGRQKDFYLEVPSDLNTSTIGVTQVYHVDLERITAKSIILGNRNWIGGGLFLGKPDVLLKFETQYRDRVLYYLSQGLMNVEQHILYSMYTKSEREKNPISVEVQTYIPGTKPVACGDPWFYLGCLMYREINEKSS